MIIVRFLSATVLALIVIAGAAMAQVTPQQHEYFDEWLRTADRAEQVIDRARASDAALEKLRSDIAGFRETFLSTRDVNAARIKTLSSQLAALGPEPAEGETEPEDLATLRARLTSQLHTLRVPRIVSDEAFSRANGLIFEIDRIIRERRTERLLSRGASPLNPVHWPAAWRQVNAGIASVVNETAARLPSQMVRETARKNLLPILLLLAMGLVLLLRARQWAERFGMFLRRFGGAGSGVWTFMVSLAKIVLPLLGVFAMVNAVELAGLLGFRGTILLGALPQWALTFLFARWLADQMFERRAGDELVPISAEGRTRAKLNFVLMATMLVLNDAIGLFARIDDISVETDAVLRFPVIVLTAFLLQRSQRSRLSDIRKSEDEDNPTRATPSGSGSFFKLARRISLVLGLAAPVLAAVGFGVAAEAIIYPVVLSMALFALVLVLQRFVTELYAWITGQGSLARDSLFSALAGFALSMFALPLFALIWGARVADLTEIWTRFQTGFQLGGTTISPSRLLVFLAVFGAGYMITRLVQGGLRTSLLPKTRIDPGGQNAIVSGTGYIGIFLAGLVGISFTGLDLSSLAIVAGALSVGIGFGLQTIVSNFVSGIILLIERPVSKGDWVEVGGIMGYVRDISVRSTRIETFDRTDVIVPNSDLISGTVTNYTRGKTIGRVIVPVGVAYGSDVRKVQEILLGIANAHPMVLGDPPPNVVFQRFGADALDFEIRAILRDVNWSLAVRSEMNFEIDRQFREAGIEIPFGQRDIWLRNPEVLAGLVSRPGPAPEDKDDKAAG
jgi:small-conductance mechanosensitive channel